MQSNFIFLCFVIGFNILHLGSHCRNAILGLKWSPIPMTNFVKVPPFVLMKIIRVFFLILRYMYFFLSRGGKNVQEEIIVAPATPAMNLMAAQLTDDNEDFANRGRYHQSEIVRGENFDDYDSN